MGCVSSVPKDDSVPPKQDNKPVESVPAQVASNNNAPSSTSMNGQAEQQEGNPNPKSPEELQKAQKQRRRLSVAPSHVGDISSIMKQINDEKKADGGNNNGLSEAEITAKGTIVHELRSKKGVVPYNRNKVNQDRGVVKYAVGGDSSVSLFGVMDGHGEFGHLVAQFVQDKLPYYLGEQTDLKSDPPKYITLAVAGLVEELATANINITFSGTTCVFGVKIDNTFYVANIGDSRCVLGVAKEDGSVEAVALTQDQKPEVPAEKARILEAGGRVQPLQGLPGEDCGPPRVWLSEVDVPGLAMSRSIGDEVSQTVGVISVPEITVHQISSPNDLFLIFASDGVWEFVSSQDAVNIVGRHQDNLQDASEQLVMESDRRWRIEEEVVDDITCVIVQLSKQK